MQMWGCIYGIPYTCRVFEAVLGRARATLNSLSFFHVAGVSLPHHPVLMGLGLTYQ